jgi:Ca2+/H+ antiporter
MIAVSVKGWSGPRSRVLALVILFAVSSFIAAGLEAARAFSSAKAGPVIGRFLLALAGLAAEVVTLA